MLRFIALRLAQGLLTLLLVSVIVFALSQSTGDPALLRLPATATDEQVEAMRARLGTDRPLPAQFGSFIANAVQGDLGTSIRLGRPVTELIIQRLPASLGLATVSMLIATLLTLPLGTVSARRRGRLSDLLIRLAAFFGMSAPVFWLGLVAIYLFAVRLAWLPTSGYGTWQHFVLPSVILSLFVTGGMTRLVRSSAIESLESQYYLAARARGASEPAAVRRHVVPNSIGPALSLAGVFFPLLISSAVVVETVFSWPGIGTLGFQAISARDFPVIQGVTLVAALLVVLSNMAVDLVQAGIDPRVREARA